MMKKNPIFFKNNKNKISIKFKKKLKKKKKFFLKKISMLL